MWRFAKVFKSQINLKQFSTCSSNPAGSQVNYCWWWLLVNTEIAYEDYWNCNFFGKQKSMIKSKVCSDTVYCQSLPWSDSCCVHCLVLVGQSRCPSQGKTFQIIVVKIKLCNVCRQKVFFHSSNRFSCQAWDHWNCWNFQSTYHRWNLPLLHVIFDSSCIIWKRKKCLYVCVLNSCLGLWKLSVDRKSVV